jgi:POT family proton-dependent oligopeptide transporter
MSNPYSSPNADGTSKPDGTSSLESGQRMSDASWFGHPNQLARLFFTEMWERFGYYGMRAILTLYLAKHFLFTDNVTNGLYGAFTSLVYLTPLFGGLIADRYLGSKRSVKFGAILMAIGYFGLCFGGEMARPIMQYQNQTYTISKSNDDATKQFVELEGTKYVVQVQADETLKLAPLDNPSGAERSLPKGSFKFSGERNMFWVHIMFLSLSSIIVGNGFFKPNISTIVGSLYPTGDGRRDAGFTIFYMGINLGSLISQFLCPLLAVWFGWWAGFLLAAIGMVLAWVLFQFDGNRLAGYGEPPTKNSSAGLIYLGGLLAIPLMWFLMFNTMQNAEVAAAAVKAGQSVWEYIGSLPILGKVLFTMFFVAIFGIPIWAFTAGTAQEAQKMVVAVILVVFSVVFWTLFEQAGSSLTLFAERNTERNIMGYEMPAGQVQIFNPLFIVFLAPVFSFMWLWLGKRNLEPNIPVKFSIGLVMVGLGFLVLVYGSDFADNTAKVGLIWLVLAYLLHSIGELCLSPVGLSMITKLSMAKVVGLMMGVWFLSSSMAQYVGGMIAQLASVDTVGGEVTNPELALATYVAVFTWIGIASLAAGALLFVLSFILKPMMHGVR